MAGSYARTSAAYAGTGRPRRQPGGNVGSVRSVSASSRRYDPSRDSREGSSAGGSRRAAPDSGREREYRRSPYYGRERRDQTAYRGPDTRTTMTQAAWENVRRNSAALRRINSGFVFFIALVVMLMVACSVYYIRLKAEYTSLIDDVSKLEYEFNQLKNENDAYYKQVTSGVDLERVRQIAIAQLGMKTPSEDQIQFYSMSDGTGYVRQYQDVTEGKE